MKRWLLMLTFLSLILSAAAPVAATDIGLVHTPPADVTPGLQIYLTAVLENATTATVVWRNSTMSEDAVAPMTNLSQPSGTGWIYAAYLPAQPVPTQIRYRINASSPSGFIEESYFFSVDYPSPGGITDEEQVAWMVTVAASLSMIASVIAVLYVYTGRRLRREGA